MMKEREKRILRLIISERDFTVLTLSQGGISYRAIGDKIGLSSGRVTQIIKKAKEKIKMLNEGVITNEHLRQKKNEFVLTARDKGQTLAEIGRKLGLSQERIRQIEYKAKQIRQIDLNGIECLPVRIQNTFTWMEITNKEDALAAINSGKLNATYVKGMKSVPNYGAKSHKIVLDWLNINSTPDY